MPWWPVIPIAVAVVVLVVWLARYSARKREEFRAAWRGVAKKLGGRWIAPAGSWWRRRSPRIEADVGGFRVVCYYFVVSTGSTMMYFTRTKARVRSGFRCRAVRRGFTSRVATTFGKKQALTGDPSYDERFVVRSRDPEHVACVFTRRVRAAHRHRPDRIEVSGTEVVVTAAGLISDPRRLEAQIRLAAVVARAVTDHPTARVG